MTQAASKQTHAPRTGIGFERISDLIGATVGIKLPSQKKLMVESRLRKRYVSIGMDNFEDYCAFVFDEGGLDDELVHIIDAITTNKTDFFRERDHLDLLADQLVREIIKARQENSPLIKIWSAASSNGAEVWSIAMVLEELLSHGADFTYSLLGTDISTAVLAKARQAIYPAEAVEPVPERLAGRYLLWGRASSQHRQQVRIVPELRRRARFERLNLMDRDYPYDRDVDVIFLRNVLIYFDKDDQEAVISRLVSHIRRHGYLIVGHSESMVVNDGRLHQIGPAIFQKV